MLPFSSVPFWVPIFDPQPHKLCEEDEEDEEEEETGMALLSKSSRSASESRSAVPSVEALAGEAGRMEAKKDMIKRLGPRQSHRCPFWLFWWKNRWPWFTWWLHLWSKRIGLPKRYFQTKPLLLWLKKLASVRSKADAALA